MKKTFVLALDDLLNNFSEKLRASGMGRYDKNDPALKRLLYDMKNGRLTESGRRIMETVQADADGLLFAEWLEQNGFAVLLCTDRDLRIAYRETEEWLKAQRICHSGLFSADNPVRFCQEVAARFFLFGLPGGEENPGGRLKLYSFFSAWPDGPIYTGQIADFADFGGVRKWIQENGC